MVSSNLFPCVHYISMNVCHFFSSSIKGIEFSRRLSFMAPLTHELLRFHGDLISLGQFQNFAGSISLNFTVFGKEKTSWKKKKVFNGNLFDTFAVTTSVVNRKMIDRFQRVIFEIIKSFDQQSCQVQIMQMATDYSRSLFVQRGSVTVSKVLVNCMPGTIKNHMLC